MNYRSSFQRRLTFPFAAMFVFLAPQFSFAAEKLQIEHSVYLGGVYMGGVQTNIEQKDRTYQIFSEAKTNKTLDWMFKWAAKAQSNGKIKDNQLTPKQHVHHSVWNDKTRGAILNYSSDGSVKAELIGKKYTNLKKYTPVDPASTKNSLDPISLILAVALKMETVGGCKGVYPVYDGRRRYDVLLDDVGEKAFKASRYSVFAGNASGCRIDIDPKGGFKRNAETNLPDGTELVIWSAAPVAEGRIVPVRMQVVTDIGTMELHLERYSDGKVSLASRTAD